MTSERERAILNSPDRARIHAAIDAIRFLGYLTPQERTALFTYTTVIIQTSQVMDANQEGEEKERTTLKVPNTQPRVQKKKQKVGQHVGGTVWYNDGQTNCRLPPDAIPPLGFVRGRIVTWNGLKCYTNGTETIKLKPADPIPEGFRPGVHSSMRPPSHLGRKSYTDGNKTIRLKPGDPIPQGFKPGKH